MPLISRSPFAKVHPSPPPGWVEDEKEQATTEEHHDRNFLRGVEYVAHYMLQNILFGIVYDDNKWHLFQDDKELQEEVKQDPDVQELLLKIEHTDEKGERKKLHDLRDATTNEWMRKWDSFYNAVAPVYRKFLQALQKRVEQRTVEFLHDLPEMLMPITRANLTIAEYEWVSENPDDFPMMVWLDPGDIDYFMQALAMVINKDLQWVAFQFVANSLVRDPKSPKHIQLPDIVSMFSSMTSELLMAAFDSREKARFDRNNPRLYRKVVEMSRYNRRRPIRVHLLALCYERMLQHEKFITEIVAQRDTLPLVRPRRNSLDYGLKTYVRPSTDKYFIQSTPKQKRPVWLAQSLWYEPEEPDSPPPFDLDAPESPRHSAARASSSRSSPARSSPYFSSMRPSLTLFDIREAKDAEEEDDSGKHPRLGSHYGRKGKRALDRLIKKGKGRLKKDDRPPSE